MRYFMYLVIAAVMLAAYLSDPTVHLLPAPFKFLPDLLSVLVVIYVVAEGSRQRFRLINSKYWLIFGALAFTMVCGALINQEAVGPIINGMRWYLRAIPMFFLPAVAKFDDQDLEKLLKVFLGFSLLQCPVALYQRLSNEAVGILTGDVVIGTMMDSGVLSLFLIAALSVMSALMLRGRLSKLWYGILFVILLIPMSVNETKVTVLLLPIALLVSFVAASPPQRRLLVSFQALLFLIVAAAIFVPVYDYYNRDVPGQHSIEDFFADSAALDKYMDRKAKMGTEEEAGRSDSLRAPFLAFAHDPVKLIFGLGPGNASKSSLGPQFTGRYKALYWNYVLELSITAFLFEIGLLGTMLLLLLHWLLLRDALFVGKHDRGLIGILAVGYLGVWFTFTIGLFYATIHLFEVLSFTFWFFSGLIASHREQLLLSKRTVNLSRPANRPLAKLRAT
jgi:hypothetical protein